MPSRSQSLSRPLQDITAPAQVKQGRSAGGAACPAWEAYEAGWRPSVHQGLQWASSSGPRLCATRSSGCGLSAPPSHEPNERSDEQGLGGERGSAGSQEGAGLTEPTLDEEPTEPPTLPAAAAAAAAAAGSCADGLWPLSSRYHLRHRPGRGPLQDVAHLWPPASTVGTSCRLPSTAAAAGGGPAGASHHGAGPPLVSTAGTCRPRCTSRRCLRLSCRGRRRLVAEVGGHLLGDSRRTPPETATADARSGRVCSERRCFTAISRMSAFSSLEWRAGSFFSPSSTRLFSCVRLSLMRARRRFSMIGLLICRERRVSGLAVEHTESLGLKEPLKLNNQITQ